MLIITGKRFNIFQNIEKLYKFHTKGRLQSIRRTVRWKKILLEHVFLNVNGAKQRTFKFIVTSVKYY
jgi:hypothetical protein